MNSGSQSTDPCSNAKVSKFTHKLGDHRIYCVNLHLTVKRCSKIVKIIHILKCYYFTIVHFLTIILLLSLFTWFYRLFNYNKCTSINSLASSLLYSPTLTSIHDYWRNHSFDQMDICQQLCLCFVICCLGLSQLFFQGTSVF